MNNTDTREAFALIVRTDDTYEFKYIPATLAGIKSAIRIEDGFIECLSTGEMPSETEWHAYADDEGAINGSEPNPNATAILRWLGWQGQTMGPFVHGDVIFLGCAQDPSGEDGWSLEGDLPPNAVHRVVSLFQANGIEIPTEVLYSRD